MSDTGASRAGVNLHDQESRQPSLWERLMRSVGLADDGSGTSAEQDREPDQHERVLIENVLHLRGMTAWDVMVPRVDIVALDDQTTFEKIVETFVAEGHSRLPVFRNDLDHVVGMIHVKDVLNAVVSQRAATLQELLRSVLFVAPSTRVTDLLSQMRLQRVHMAFVVDEFGGIDGLVTIEDLVEQIVGEIEDEHDEAGEANLIERADGAVIADARTPIEEVEALLGAKLLPSDVEEEVDTLGGLCFMLVGQVPRQGDIIEHPQGFTFEILEGDERRIRLIRISHKTGAAPAESSLRLD